MLHGLHAAFETSAPTEGGLTAVVLSRTHTSATVLADDCVRRSGAARRASASAIKAWCRADDSVAGLDIAFHSSGRRAAVADLGSGGTSKSSASASVPVSRSVILKGAVVVLVRGRGPHPAGRSAAAVAVRGEHCLPNSASRWGTPDLATPIRAVAKPGVDAWTVEGDSLEGRRTFLLSSGSHGRHRTEPKVNESRDALVELGLGRPAPWPISRSPVGARVLPGRAPDRRRAAAYCYTGADTG